MFRSRIARPCPMRESGLLSLVDRGLHGACRAESTILVVRV